MTTGAELTTELAQVVAPADSGFSVRQVPSAPDYRIGRGTDGAVVLLTPADAAPLPPTRLKRLSLDPRLRCRLDDAAGGHHEELFGVVQFHEHDPSLVQPFLDVCAAVVRLLGPAPAPGEVSTAMRRLVRLFEPSDPASGSVPGLWAELLVIARSIEVSALVDAWHTQTDARFDFAAAGSRLEVKCTLRDTRIHQFNLRQLQPVVGVQVYVTSVMTTETQAGTSVAELVQRVEQLLGGDTNRQIRVHEVVASTLGPDWGSHVQRRFDEQQGSDALVILDAADIPRVEDWPEHVLEVHLTVDCADVPIVTAPDGLAGLVRSSAS